MDQETKLKLQEVLAKDPPSLTEGDIALLRARRAYLTEHERIVFAQYLPEDERPQLDNGSGDAPKPAKGAKDKAKAAPAVEDPNSMSALKRRAAALKLKFIGVSKLNLQKSVEAAEAAAKASPEVAPAGDNVNPATTETASNGNSESDTDEEV